MGSIELCVIANTEDIGYYGYLGTRPKNGHRLIIVA